LFGLLNLEEVSLLIGSLLMFAALATVMFATRRVDWSTIGMPDREAMSRSREFLERNRVGRKRHVSIRSAHSAAVFLQRRFLSQIAGYVRCHAPGRDSPD
jgi:hypothetical protein